MTGIERLRQMARQRDTITVPLVNGTYQGGYIAAVTDVCGRLADIADQIEREHACDGDTIENLRLELGEQSEAIAWVREHGGLDAVKAHWSGRVALSHVQNMAERQRAKRERMQRHIEFVERKCRERQACIVELNKLVAEMRPRLMPEGMEWPRFEDGEPVRVGDSAPFGTDDVMEVVGVEINRFGYVLHGSINDGMRECVDGDEHGVAVKRPAPKVLDANGVEIRVGDKLYYAKTGCSCIVRDINADGTIELDGHENRGWRADRFMHRAPVLAADGLPLREGETVWVTMDEPHDAPLSRGDEVTVRFVSQSTIVHVEDEEGSVWYVGPNDLTHERPVNHCFECSHWQVEPGRDRLGVCWDTYGERECEDSYAAVLGTSEACAQFERRAKALAERDA